MAIRQGLIGNPVIQGLLGGGGPAAIKAAKNKALFESMPRGQAVRMSAPGAIVRPPDNSMGQGLSALGKALGDIGDMRAESAAQKDLAALFEPTVVGEPGTGESMTVQPKVGSTQLATFLAKHSKAPNASKQAGVLYQNAIRQEAEQRGYEQTAMLLDKRLGSSEKIAKESNVSREKISSNTLNAQMKAAKLKNKNAIKLEDIRFGNKQTLQNEQIASRESEGAFDRLNKFQIAEMRTVADNNGLKSTNQGIYSEGKLVGNLFNSKQGPFVFDTQEGKFRSLEEISKKYPGYQQMPSQETGPNNTEMKTKKAVSQEVGTAAAEVKTISNIVSLVKQNTDNVGFTGDLKASLVNVGGILQDIVGENKFTEFGVGLVGGQRDKDFLNNLDSRSEKLKEALIRLRQAVKKKAPTVKEIEEITALTDLRQWASSEKLTANIQEIERRLKEDLAIINKSNADAGLTESPAPSKKFTWTKK